MKKTRLLRYVTYVAFLLATTCLAQNAGNVGIQTVGPIPIFTNATTTGASTCVPGNCVIRSIGQSQHTVRYCVNQTTASVSAIALQLEASDDGTVWSAVSDLGTNIGITGSNSCFYLPGSPGYYPMLRVHVLAFNFTAGATYSVSYSGAAAPSGLPGLGQNLSSRQATMSSIQSNALQNHTSWSETASRVNPAGNTGILWVQPQVTNGPFVYLDKLIVSCTAACTFDITTSTSNGTGCATPTQGTNLGVGLGGNTSSQNVFDISTCGVAPGQSNTGVLIQPINLAANTPFILDVSSIVVGSAKGVVVRNSGALTGTITATLFFYER